MKKSKTFMLALVVMTVLGFTVMGTGMGLAACPENIIGYWKLDKPNPGGGYKDDIKGSTGVGDGSLTTETGIIKNCRGFRWVNNKNRYPPTSRIQLVRHREFFYWILGKNERCGFAFQ